MEPENNGQAPARRSNERMRGTHIKVPLLLTNPDLIKAYAKVYATTENNLYYITMIAPGSLRDDYPPNAMARIEEQLTLKFEALVRLDEHVIRLLEAAGAPMGESAGSEKMQISIRTRVAKRYVDLWAKCDDTLMKVDTAWLHGLITDEKRGEFLASVVKQVNKFWTETSADFRSMQRKSQERRGRSAKATGSSEPGRPEAAGDDPAKDPHDRADLVIDEAARGLKAA